MSINTERVIGQAPSEEVKEAYNLIVEHHSTGLFSPVKPLYVTAKRKQKSSSVKIPKFPEGLGLSS